MALPDRQILGNLKIYDRLSSDWFNSWKWGQRREACEEIGFDYQHAMDCAAVCKAFQFSCRQENLTFTHHEVAMLAEPEDRDRWLTWAIENRALPITHAPHPPMPIKNPHIRSIKKQSGNPPEPLKTFRGYAIPLDTDVVENSLLYPAVWLVMSWRVINGFGGVRFRGLEKTNFYISEIL